MSAMTSRTGQRQQVVIAAERVVMVDESVAAIVRLRQAMTLHHGAHRAVDDEDASFEGVSECGRSHGRVFRMRN